MDDPARPGSIDTAADSIAATAKEKVIEKPT